MKRHAIALLLLLAPACASSPAQRPDEPLLEEQVARPAAGSAAALPGTIRRADLLRVLATSPGQFLAGVDAVPEVQAGGFRGWRIRSFFPTDPRVNTVLRSGDLVQRVNDHAVERPDQFIEVWQAAGARPDLTVDLLRAGQPLRLAWRIVDGK